MIIFLFSIDLKELYSGIFKPKLFVDYSFIFLAFIVNGLFKFCNLFFISGLDFALGDFFSDIIWLCSWLYDMILLEEFNFIVYLHLLIVL